MDYIQTRKYRNYSFPLISNKIKLLCLFVVTSLVLLSGVFTPPYSQQNKKVLGVVTAVEKSTTGEDKIEVKKSVISFSSKQYAMVFRAEIVAKEYVAPTPTPTSLPTKMPIQASSTESDDKPLGVATQIGPDTWTMKVQHDPVMATPGEVFAALNTYRQKKGREILSLDDKLVEYAQSRADLFAGRGDIDGHAGFRDLLKNQDGFTKLGFGKLGENSSWGYVLNGTHLIEWIYAGDAPHDDNQLNPEWTHVGIGVNDTSTDLVFGGRKR